MFRSSPYWGITRPVNNHQFGALFPCAREALSSQRLGQSRVMGQVLNNIRKVRLQRDMTLKEVAAGANTSYQQIEKLEKGQRRLTDDWLFRMARALECAPTELLQTPGDLKEVAKSIRYAPIMSWVEAGKLAESGGIPADDRETVPVPYGRDTIIALRVVGSSMNLIAPEGSIVIVDYEDRSPEDGHRYVFRSGDEISFKKYRSGNGPPRLEPESSESGHETIFPDDSFEIIGRVVRVVNEV